MSTTNDRDIKTYFAESHSGLEVIANGLKEMTFGEFVASRNLEFGVHTMDVAHAVGRPERVRPAAASIITGILDGLLAQPVPDSLPWDTTTSSGDRAG